MRTISENKQVRTFVTIPRFQTGIPYTLATITDQMGPSGPVLKPYPSYRAHNVNGDDCDQITSAFRVAVSTSQYGKMSNVRYKYTQKRLYDYTEKRYKIG